MKISDNYIIPNWPAPKNIKAFTTRRNLNFKLGSSDLLINRQKLRLELELPAEPFWLTQQHTNIALALTKQTELVQPIADASFTKMANLVCAVMTADCVPILVCNTKGSEVAAIHAGWKGIAGGVIEQTVSAMHTDPGELLAWMGPAIGSNAFQVGLEIVDIFTKLNPDNRLAFTINGDNNYYANIFYLATQSLKNTGITKIYGGEYCTFSQSDLFFSYRRDGEASGRMASLIWFES